MIFVTYLVSLIPMYHYRGDAQGQRGEDLFKQYLLWRQQGPRNHPTNDNIARCSSKYHTNTAALSQEEETKASARGPDIYLPYYYNYYLVYKYITLQRGYGAALSIRSIRPYLRWYLINLSVQ